MTKQKELLPVLLRTRAFVQQGWCQGDPAQDATGKAVSPIDPFARRWCLVEAMKRALWEIDERFWLTWDDPIYRAILSQLLPSDQFTSISSYNDLPTTRQQDVLAVLDRAIAHAGK